jgi:O-antigen ligase
MSFYYIFLLLGPFQEHPKLGEVLLNVWLVPITVTKLVGILMVFAAFLAPIPDAAARRQSTAIQTLYAFFVFIPLIEVIVSGLSTPTRSLSALISYGLLLSATRRLVSTAARLQNVLRILVLAETIGSLWLYKQQYIEHLVNPHGPSSDPNYEALSIVMMLPLALYLVFHDKNRFWRLSALFSLPMLTFAVFVSQSRGGVVALITVSLLGWLHSPKKLSFAVGGLLLAVALAISAPSVTWNRFEQIQVTGRPQTGAEMSTRTRIELWRGGIRMIGLHPLSGIGLDQFKNQVGYYNAALYRVSNRAYIAHNTYIQIAAEEGLPILVIFVCMLWLAIRNLDFAVRAGSFRGLDDVAGAMRFGLIAYLIAACFLSAQFEKTLWVFVALSQNVREIVADQAKLSRNHAEAQNYGAA